MRPPEPASAAAIESAAPLPRTPMRFIGAEGGWGLAELYDAWAARELLQVLIARDLKVRYRQAAIGVAWVVLQPVAMLLLFRAFYVNVLDRSQTTSGVPYVVSAYVGLLWWQFVASSIREGTNSLVQNRVLVTKVYFPRILLPLSSVGAALFDLVVGSVVLLAIMVANGVSPGWPILAAPLYLAFGVATVSAAAVWSATLNAIYRDVGHVVPFLLQVGFFVTPVVYETGDFVPEQWQWWFRLNPVTLTIEGLRWSLLGGRDVGGSAAVLSAILTACGLAGGLWYLRRIEVWIADRI